MKKILLTFILALILSMLIVPAALADSATGVAPNIVVTLDSATGDITAGNLAVRVSALIAPNIVTDIGEFHVGTDVGGSLNTADTTYINSMSNLQVLDVATTVTIGNVGGDFQRNNSSLQTVYFPATTFGDNAFFDCDALTSASLPQATTFINSAFSDCYVLASVSLPQATTFGNDAFNECYALTNVDLPQAITFGDSAFIDCSTLTSISLPQATTFARDAFASCSALTSVSLPQATTFDIITFNDCGSLNSLTLGSVPPTVASWGTINLTPGTLNVPQASVAAYDANQQTWTPAGTSTDNLWEGWTLVGIAPAPAINPQTGDDGVTIPYILLLALLASGIAVYGVLMMKKKVSN